MFTLTNYLYHLKIFKYTFSLFIKSLNSLYRKHGKQVQNCIFKRFYLFIFREKGGEGEREGEKHRCVVASCVLPAADLAHNPGMCPDWESNQQPFSLQAVIQSTEPHQLGLKF